MPEITDPNGDGTTGTPPAGTPPKTPEAPKPITFASQEELDAIIEARVARAKPKDYDELVALREKVTKAAEQEKTDLQKEKDARVAAEAKAAEAESKANAILIRAAIMTEAAAQNAADADVVVSLLAGNESITVDGEQVKGAKAAVKKLLEEKPFLVKASQTPGASGGQFGGNDSRTLKERIAEAESKGDWSQARRLKSAQLVGG